MDDGKLLDTNYQKKAIIGPPGAYAQKVHCDTSQWTLQFKCVVSSCPNSVQKYHSDDSVNYHSFPQNSDLRQIWLKKCGIPEYLAMETAKVCSDHFLPSDYESVVYKQTPKGDECCRNLKVNAVPHQNLRKVETVKPNYDDVKRAVDENLMLKEQMETLVNDREALQLKIHMYESRHAKRKLELQKLKQQYDKLKKRNCSVREQKNLLRKVFSEAQIGIMAERKKVVWSDDDLAMAFTLRQMGSRDCYLYLKETLNIPLPALSCVQKWVASQPSPFMN